MPDDGPLDAVVGAVAVTSDEGVEFRQVLGEHGEGRVHVTPDGRSWVVVAESIAAGDAIVSTSPVLHWRPLQETGWARPVGPLVPAETLAGVEHALSLFAWPGTAAHDDLLQAVRAALPPVHALSGLLDDALAVLQGDRDAAARFRDAAEALGLVSSSYVDRASESLLDFIRGTGIGSPLGVETGARAVARAVPTEREVLLVLAAFQAADGGDLGVGARYAAVLHEQICRYEALSALHRSAVKALAGDEAARVGLWSALCLMGGYEAESGTWLGPPAPPPPHPPAPGPVGQKPPFTFPVVERRSWPPFKGFDPCVLLAAKTLHLSDNRYLVSGVAPARACPGEVLTITGMGFGGAPGTVRFRTRGTPPGSAPIDVAPISWTDTSILVTVPPNAGWGIQLVIPVDSWLACGSVVELFKQGQFMADFAGGAPDVVLFSVAGVSAWEGSPGACTIEPSAFWITWDVRSVDRVAIDVRGPGDVPLEVKDPAPSAGSWQINAQAITQTTPLRVRLVAWGTCAPAVVERLVTVTVQRTPQLAVDGLEVTQAIQHYHAWEHLTDPSDIGPDNSLRLVADKPAFVRVYVRSGQDPGFDNGELPGVSGTLQVRRLVGGVWTLVATLKPTPSLATVTARADPPYWLERGSLTRTLNFVVEAGQMFGHMRLTAEVMSPAAVVGGGPAYRSVDVDVTLLQTLKVAGALVAYNGPPALNAPATAAPLTLPAPTQGALEATAAVVLRMYPVSAVGKFRVAGTLTQTVPLQDARLPNSCTANWDALMADLHDLADDDGNQPGWLYYGLLANGTPIGRAPGQLIGGVTGCGGHGVGVGEDGDGLTMAEELGHALGLDHAPCGANVQHVDPNYPAYEPYDSAQSRGGVIGEYGLDLAPSPWPGAGPAPVVVTPQTPDVMGYCGPMEWISPYHHGRLLNVGLLSPVTLTAAPRQVRRSQIEAQPVISVTAFLDAAGAVETVRIRRRATRPDHRRDEPTDLVAELQDSTGEVISSGVVHAMSLQARTCAQGPTEGSRLLLKAYLPDTARGARLRLRRKEQELWSREAPAEAVSVSRVDARLDVAGRLQIQWEAIHLAGIESTSVRWSADNGESWRPLTVGLAGHHADLDIDSLPGGDLLFEVAAHNGFDTVTGTSPPVRLPHRAPLPTILHPAEDARLDAAAPLRLWGSGTDESGERLPDQACQWFLDDKPLEAGADVFVDPPLPGRHHARFVVEDVYGRSERSRSFTLVDNPES